MVVVVVEWDVVVVKTSTWLGLGLVKTSTKERFSNNNLGAV